MRVGFFGQTGPYAPSALRLLLAGAGAYEIALVVEGRKTPARGLDHRLRKPRPGSLPPGDDLADLGVAAGIPVLQTADVNAPTAVRTLRDFDLDLLVCVGFDRLWKPEVLATARRGGLNAHPSKLPSLRGPAPLFWALKLGLRELTVTVHGIDAHEDHGPVYDQASCIMPHRQTGEQLYGLAAGLAARVLMGLLRRVAVGELTGVPQDHARKSRAPRPLPEDALVDPAQFRAEHLVDFACGAPYFKSPWLRSGDEVFFVRRGLQVELGRQIPGQYVQQGTTLIVQCQDGLAFLEIQV